jgi:hypothetical protein
MIHHHSLARAVAQARISDLIAESVADGRTRRWSRRWRLRLRWRSAPVVTPERIAINDGDTLWVGFDRYDPQDEGERLEFRY